jgi:N-acyl homoserine lactone hydrolase
MQPIVNRGQQELETRRSVRLYVLDCGKIGGVTAEEFGFKRGEISSEMFTPCFLIVHPRGSLLWDTGEIPDGALEANRPTTHRSFTVSKPLLPQLEAIGYSPSDIRYLALSHYHNDHVANANAFAGCTWLVQRAERDVMFAPEPDTERNGPIQPNQPLFSALEFSSTVIIENADHDVFGDGRVVIKFTPGHTPGHQSLFVRLDNFGPVLITGDLYHYQAEVKRTASFVNHASNDIATRSRRAVEAFIEEEDAQLWIQHDAAHGAALRKSPGFYD